MLCEAKNIFARPLNLKQDQIEWKVLMESAKLFLLIIFYDLRIATGNVN